MTEIRKNKGRPAVLGRILRLSASPRLTIYTVAALILLSLVGALVPQRGLTNVHELYAWQTARPVLSRILALPGFFSVFHSLPFLLTLLALAVNTLACTVSHLLKEGFLSAASPGTRLRRIGFLGLHISVLICIAGGMISAGYRLSGHVVLTEGQTVFDEPYAYPKLAVGPLRKEKHGAFQLQLAEADIKIEESWHPTEMTAKILVSDGHTLPVVGTLDFNRPYTFGKTTFTLREIGYSPEVLVTGTDHSGAPAGGFVSLRVWGFAEERKHYDFLPLPSRQQKLVMTLYPSHAASGENYTKTGEVLTNPLLLLHLESLDGQASPSHGITRGESITLDGLKIEFRALRQWAAFQVVSDPGYPIVCVALITCIASLALRYLPDITDWIKESKQNGTA